jgi:hypothetical protein
MAEIKIEKKKPIWPWILVILLILAAILFFWFNNDQSNEAEIVPNDTTTQMEETNQMEETDVDQDNSNILYNGKYGKNVSEQAVANYFKYLDNEQMGIDHQYTNGALIHLITAVETEAKQLNVTIDANIEKARQNAFEITKDPMSLKHADKIRAAALEITTALKTIQQQKFSSLSSEVDGLKTAAEKINPQTPTLEQKEDAKDFFEKAGRLLQKMNEYENNQ